MDEPDKGMNLAVFNAEELLLNEHEMEDLQNSHQPQKPSRFHMLYDQLVYPFIFWTGSGGCGVHQSEKLPGSVTSIRKVLISLILQPRDHFIHQFKTLREEFICAVYGHLINLSIKWPAQGQRRSFAGEDDVPANHSEDSPKGYGVSNFIRPSLVDSADYWHYAAAKSFALSTQLGCPSSFLTLTMNPVWTECQAVKRGDKTFRASPPSSPRPSRRP
jgi:hypothetical protein